MCINYHMEEQNQYQPHKNNIVAFIAIFVVAFVLGLFIGAQFLKGGLSQDNTFEAGWNSAKKRLADSPQFGPMASGPAEVSKLSGVVQMIDGNKITISINPVEPLADPNLDTRVVIVGDATTIVRIVPRDSQELQAEIDAFMKEMREPLDAGQESPVPPIPVTREDVQLVDIKVDDRVVVVAETNIKDVKEFAITNIEIQ